MAKCRQSDDFSVYSLHLIFFSFQCFGLFALWWVKYLIGPEMRLNSLWLIFGLKFLQMKGETIVNALREQVIHYTIQESLFDIILAALVRFLLLLTFYGLFAINHWSIIAVSCTTAVVDLLHLNKITLFFFQIKLTTTASCAFLIGKVFYYDVSVHLKF